MFLDSIENYPNDTCKPHWTFIQPDRLEIMYNAGCLESISRFIFKKGHDCIPLNIQQELFYRCCIDGKLDLLNLLLENPNIDISAQSDFEKRSNSGVVYSDAIQLMMRLSPGTRVNDENDAICFAAANGHYHCVKRLLNDSRLRLSNIFDALDWAMGDDHFDCFKLLLEDGRIDPSLYNNTCLEYAALEGHHRCLELLLKDDRVTAPGNSMAVTKAARNGHIQCLRLLLADSRFAIQLNYHAIRAACESGYADCVQLLLTNIESLTTEHVKLLANATVRTNQLEVLKIILSHPKTKPFLNHNDAQTIAKRTQYRECQKLLIDFVNDDSMID
ncbi:ankyrin repeat-containing domain protein [Globomyces pollinis-pini]|nr:ankyrin repeat-containing domain protein [Globomyces pollinis-pini]